MKRRFSGISALAIVVALVLSSCGKAEEGTPLPITNGAAGNGNGGSYEPAASGKIISDKLREDSLAAADAGLAFLNGTYQAAGEEIKQNPGMVAFILHLNAVRNPGIDVDAPENATIKEMADYLVGLQKTEGEYKGGIYVEELPNYHTSMAIMALVKLDKERYRETIESAIFCVRSLQYAEQMGIKEDDPRYGGIGYGSNPAAPDMSNTQYAIEALRAAGIPEDDPALQKALKFLTRIQNRSESNDQDWAGNSGGGIYKTIGDSKAGEEILPDGRKGYRSYGSMTYAMVKSMVYAGLTKEDDRVKAALGWISNNYTVDVNPGMPAAQSAEGLFYYYHTFAKTFQVLEMDFVEPGTGQKFNWREDLLSKLISLKKKDPKTGATFWLNDEDRFWEDNPVLATSYAVGAILYALDFE